MPNKTIRTPEKRLIDKSLSFFRKRNLFVLKNVHKNSKIIFLSVVILFLALFINLIIKKSIMASVNGKYISRIRFYKELEKNDGRKTLDDMITKEIIYQEAKNKNINIANNEVDAEIANISDSVIKQGSTLNEVLSLQGLTLADLKENIKIQKILENILSDKITVTDEEASKRFDENKDIYGKDKKLDDVKDSIKAQISQEKLTTAYRDWIQKIKSSSNIKYFVNL